MIKSNKFTGIKLTLTMEQAYYLRQVLWHIGGSPAGPRGQMDEICEELEKYSGDFDELDIPGLEIDGTVIMNNYEEKA